MPSGLILALAAGLAIGAPALAQDAAPAPARALAPSDADINTAADAFRTQVEAMNAEVRAAVQAAGSSRRRASARVEEVLARYQPGFESFAVQLEAWFSRRAAAAATDEARASIVQTGAASVARVRGVPDQVRAGLAQQARSAPEQPRNTQPSTGY
ncbi:MULTISPECIES: hypothetical protein [unclassified Brevundimonas]|uniref:hypothetical protein n=1 Tax=unclassified Brevundimonas TaxID=2622653 RepID=UPI0006FB978B|nr:MULTISPECIES: hypothetical protein [unclassified Brevundimonas]KQY62326.1 hypothetical protein ASD25_15720 [Brevundimonas sp. Root1423]KRA21724.1 hypothetical protein ASD59_11240 [Brevundimonas sp. Root608]